ncbi:hypothetical protein T484DRAFT_2369526 [Baffinella frigidus]|nr:hypothetical protein T484DRAFT_2369526 [Cryptophyta sp. CCMP2293]
MVHGLLRLTVPSFPCAAVGALCLTMLVLGYVFYKWRATTSKTPLETFSVFPAPEETCSVFPASEEVLPLPPPPAQGDFAEIEAVDEPLPAARTRLSVAAPEISCEASARPQPPAMYERAKPGVAAGATLVEAPNLVKDSFGELHVVRSVPKFAKIQDQSFEGEAGPPGKSLSPGDKYRQKMSSVAVTVQEEVPGLATGFNGPAASYDAPAAGSIAAAIAAALARVRAPEGVGTGWGGRGGAPRVEEADSTMMARGFASTSAGVVMADAVFADAVPRRAPPQMAPSGDSDSD